MRAKEERNAFFPPFSSSPPSHPIYYAHTVVAFGSKMKFRDFCNFNARAPDDQDDFSNVRFFTYARDSFVQSSSNFFRRARYIFLFFFYSSETMHEHQWDERRVILILWKSTRDYVEVCNIVYKYLRIFSHEFAHGFGRRLRLKIFTFASILDVRYAFVAVTCDARHRATTTFVLRPHTEIVGGNRRSKIPL